MLLHYHYISHTQYDSLEMTVIISGTIYCQTESSYYDSPK